MNFSSAVKGLRDGQCIKTPGMTGYVKRVDAAGAEEVKALLRTAGGSLASAEVRDISAPGVTAKAGEYLLAPPYASARSKRLYRLADLPAEPAAPVDAGGDPAASWEDIAPGTFSADRVYSDFFYLAFVENPAYSAEAGGAGGDGDSAAEYRFAVLRQDDSGPWEVLSPAAAASAPLRMDARLMQLVAFSDDWGVYQTADIESVDSSARW